MKRNWLTYLILFLLVVNLSVTGTFLVKQREIKRHFKQGRDDSKMPMKGPEDFSMRIFKENMKLSEEQIHGIKNAHKGYRQFNEDQAAVEEHLRAQFYRELTSGAPDTMKLLGLAKQKGSICERRMEETFRHYLAIRKDLSKDEVKLLDSLTARGWQNKHHGEKKYRERQHHFNKNENTNLKNDKHEKD